MAEIIDLAGYRRQRAAQRQLSAVHLLETIQQELNDLRPFAEERVSQLLNIAATLPDDDPLHHRIDHLAEELTDVATLIGSDDLRTIALEYPLR